MDLSEVMEIQRTHSLGIVGVKEMLLIARIERDVQTAQQAIEIAHIKATYKEGSKQTHTERKETDGYSGCRRIYIIYI